MTEPGEDRIMCLDPRKPESGPVLAAAGLAERLRLAADDHFEAAAELERRDERIAELGRLVARQRAEIERLRAEIERLLKKGGREE